MKIPSTKPFLALVLLIAFASPACTNGVPIEPTSTPATLSFTQTPIPAPLEPTLAPVTNTLTPTQTPTSPPPTATATAIPASPTPALSVLDFRQMSDVVLIFDPLSPETLYTKSRFVGSPQSNYQSTDGGITWKVVGPDPESVEIQQSLQGEHFWRDPQTPTTIYGISEATMSLVKSVDGGQSWTPLAVPFEVMFLTAGIGIFEIDPRNPDVLYITNFSGMVRSNDGGLTWHEASGLPEPGPSGLNFFQFIFDLTVPDTIYVLDMLWGAFKSTDGGESWSSMNAGQGQNSFYPRWLVIDPTDSNTLFAMNGVNGKTFTSIDGGQTWTETDLGLPSPDVYAFAIDPLNPSIRYAILGVGDLSGLFKSTDNGQTWIEIATSLLSLTQLKNDITAFTIDPTALTTLYLGTTDGVWVLLPEG